MRVVWGAPGIVALGIGVLTTFPPAASPAQTAPGPAPAGASIMLCDAKDPAAVAEQRLSQAESPGQAATDKAAAMAAIAKIDAMRERMERGEPLEAPYDSVSGAAGQARKETDPVKAELFRRVARDQFARSHFTAASAHAGWAAGLSPAALAYAYSIVATRDWCGLDESNTAWLKAQIDARGWFKRTTDGDAAAGAAFLMTQHADRDKPFQKKVLALMEPLLASKDVRPQDYALLFDRVAVGEGRPQRYGSQGRCTGPGVWTENAVENAATLDQTRAGVGLEPMAAYRARFVAVCGGAPA